MKAMRGLLLTLAVLAPARALDFRSIMTYLQGDPQFSVLVGLLHSAHLDVVLEAPGAIFTLFAPTNTAFQNLSPSVMSQISASPALLQKVLMTHVLDSAFISIFFKNDRLEQTLGGGRLRINLYGHTYTAGGAAITQGDIVLRNGVLHVVDNVILPPEGDVLTQILMDDAEFEDLTAALAVTNLLDDLELDSMTLFAPLNTAFQEYYSHGLPTNMTQVTDMLLNHVVNGTYYTAGIKTGDSVRTLSGHQLHFTKNGNKLIVNGHATDGDIFATNGVIHVMTAVLDPSGT